MRTKERGRERETGKAINPHLWHHTPAMLRLLPSVKGLVSGIAVKEEERFCLLKRKTKTLCFVSCFWPGMLAVSDSPSILAFVPFPLPCPRCLTSQFGLMQQLICHSSHFTSQELLQTGPHGFTTHEWKLVKLFCASIQAIFFFLPTKLISVWFPIKRLTHLLTTSKHFNT